MASSQNPSAHTGTLLTADGARGPALPHFFIERYLPSYILQWEAFCSYARSGGTSPVVGRRRAGAARRRAGGLAFGRDRPVGRSGVDGDGYSMTGRCGGFVLDRSATSRPSTAVDRVGAERRP